ncbi:hypothetical protein DFH07DRAFT_19050 [Mycena maculata]|uniref:F-box domain-containing protein n=1 Tax=Mycena maculata TaxID=230809 RepID=A0AAD7N577_9AGAR|nr:hypothetical protein DFH07DRAFT_19050 [Mycena maculata]
MPRQTRNKVIETTNEPPKKRAKTKAASTRANASTGSPARRFRGRGQLNILPDMPLDILFEIFSQLEPLDVLRLARTTKDLRSVLMSHSAISIWKSAFLNDPDLPGVPDGLNEPQYANLAFSPHCHLCFAAGEHSILWAFHLRVCQSCLFERFDDLYKVTKKLAPGNEMSRNSQLLRRATVGYRSVYSYEEAAEINTKLVKLKKGDASKLEEYIKERQRLVEGIQAHASKAEMSGALRNQRMQRIHQEARERRKDLICTRLTNLGYEEEVQYLKDSHPEVLSEHTLIKSINPLTDRMWHNMKAVLVELMEDVREKMQRKKRKSLLKKRQALLVSVLKNYTRERPIDEVNPSAIDVCVLIPRTTAMLEDSAPDTYTTAESFEDLMADFPSKTDAWRAAKTQDLLALIPGPPRDHDFLRRATTFFRCADCNEPLGYPRVLAHACLSSLRHGHRNREDDLALLCAAFGVEPWNHGGGRVEWHPTTSMSAEAVVRACGLSTEMTTAQDMDDVGAWLECKRCAHKVRGRAVFRWRKAILHDMYHAAAGETGTWRLLGDLEAEAAEGVQEALQEKSYVEAADYACVRCHEKFSFAMMRVHLRVGHGIDVPEAEEDYVLQVDASMDQPPFSVYLPPGAVPSPEVIEVIQVPDDADKLAYMRTCIVVDD